jgi:hypothetical protein
MAQNIERELREQVSGLSNEQQRQVLDFVRSLAMLQRNGASGQAFLNVGGKIELSELAIMEQVIHEGCETVIPDGI